MGAILASLPVVIQSVTALINWINTVRAAAQQTGDWTPGLEAQHQAMLLATKTDPAWQPDKPS